MTSTYSRVRCTRRSNGTPSAANSSAIQPTPMPSAKRPPDSRSRLAACFARISGLCSGTRQMPVASRIERVTDAAKLSATNGSSQSIVAGSEKLPLSAYGYRESWWSNSTTCSPIHSVAKPAASAARAVSQSVAGRAPRPIPIAARPTFMRTSVAGRSARASRARRDRSPRCRRRRTPRIAIGMPIRVMKSRKPITIQSSANQKVRICQRKCDSRNVPRTSRRFT